MISPQLLSQLQTGNVPFIGARWFIPMLPGNRKVLWIVMHSMEAPDKPGTARGVAGYFQTLTRQASAHYCVDDGEIIQCVQTKDIADGAPGANQKGVHIELAGYAAQSAQDWQNSLQEIENAAWLAGLILVPKFSIPIRFCDAAALQAGEMGFTTHLEVSRAFKRSSHTDPGPNFPMQHFLSIVQEARAHVTA